MDLKLKQQLINCFSVTDKNFVNIKTDLWKEISEEEASNLCGGTQSHRRDQFQGDRRGGPFRWFDERGGIGHDQTRHMQFDRGTRRIVM